MGHLGDGYKTEIPEKSHKPVQICINKNNS